MTTGVEIWAPAFDHAGFSWLRSMPVEYVFEGPLLDYRVGGQYRCRLCETFLHLKGELEPHAAVHLEEYLDWKHQDNLAKKQPLLPLYLSPVESV